MKPRPRHVQPVDAELIVLDIEAAARLREVADDGERAHRIARRNDAGAGHVAGQRSIAAQDAVRFNRGAASSRDRPVDRKAAILHVDGAEAACPGQRPVLAIHGQALPIEEGIGIAASTGQGHGIGAVAAIDCTRDVRAGAERQQVVPAVKEDCCACTAEDRAVIEDVVGKSGCAKDCRRQCAAQGAMVDQRVGATDKTNRLPPRTFFAQPKSERARTFLSKILVH